MPTGNGAGHKAEIQEVVLDSQVYGSMAAGEGWAACPDLPDVIYSTVPNGSEVA